MGNERTTGTGNPAVYIVDDDPSVCRALERLLRSYGLSSATFGSADELLDEGSWSQAGCFLIDIRMPGTNGFELAERLTAAGSAAPVIFMSAHAEVSHSWPEARRAVAFLRKPLDDRLLIGALREALCLRAATNATTSASGTPEPAGR